MGSQQTKDTPQNEPQHYTPPEKKDLLLNGIEKGEIMTQDLAEKFRPHVPPPSRDEWTLLYLNKTQGRSFNRLKYHTKNQGPTLIIIKDDKGYIFGGFASQSWKKPGAAWYGDVNSFLFSIKPEFKVYPATGYNDHYQYLNEDMETMPNGLGMGGQHEFFGIFLEERFDYGLSNGTCSTFRSPCLSSEARFAIETVEVWGTKLPPKIELEDEYEEVDDDDPNAEIGPDGEKIKKKKKKKSVMSSENNPDKMIMEMLGRVGYSAGLEPPEE
eukprot:TRINITY_DN6952_c0_g1_i1.p1 TRINITY_DN6952_c0_g1~~TRINITY_DN6952_c0_g1_i1.p1  ORF type:complete len:270 (+),score=75.98 TRINITY_DN6952_c0_g1_i1:2-811(+)